MSRRFKLILQIEAMWHRDMRILEILEGASHSFSDCIEGYQLLSRLEGERQKKAEGGEGQASQRKIQLHTYHSLPVTLVLFICTLVKAALSARLPGCAGATFLSGGAKRSLAQDDNLQSFWDSAWYFDRHWTACS